MVFSKHGASPSGRIVNSFFPCNWVHRFQMTSAYRTEITSAYSFPGTTFAKRRKKIASGVVFVFIGKTKSIIKLLFQLKERNITRQYTLNTLKHTKVKKIFRTCFEFFRECSNVELFILSRVSNSSHDLLHAEFIDVVLQLLVTYCSQSHTERWNNHWMLHIASEAIQWWRSCLRTVKVKTVVVSQTLIFLWKPIHRLKISI